MFVQLSPAVYLTGDTHGHFERIEDFCAENLTSPEDTLIILGDVCLNVDGSPEDDSLKWFVSRLPITLFCIHGNHEERPYNVPGYEEMEWHGGLVYIQPEYPNILFAIDGEVYDFYGKKAIAIGGAYTIAGRSFRDEQPDEQVKAHVEDVLARRGWKIDYVLSHTVPLYSEPTWAFLPGVDQRTVDRSTEVWLQSLESRLTFECWYCGHYHVDVSLDKHRILYYTFMELGD